MFKVEEDFQNEEKNKKKQGKIVKYQFEKDPHEPEGSKEKNKKSIIVRS